jgi:hypothetical protein
LRLRHEVSVTMIRKWWQRLVACISLVAFLAANTHAGTAIAASVAARPAGKPGHVANAKGKKASRRSCCHCVKDKDRRIPDAPRDHGNDPCSPSCPDCPKGPGDSKCPCPGGCALCSVAKVPCPVVAASPIHEAPCLEGSVTEIEPSYLSPAIRTLIRPPRA